MPTTGIRAGANASDTRLSLVPEAVWGTTPTTPAFQNIRFTGENLQPNKETVRSQEIRPDRNVIDEIMVGRSVSGNMDFELSFGTFDDLLESLFHAEWDDDVLINGSGIGQAFTAERTLKLNDGLPRSCRSVARIYDRNRGGQPVQGHHSNPRFDRITGRQRGRKRQ